MQIGSNIKNFRKRLNLTQDDLGKILNVSGRTISSWEINRTEPNMGMINKMCKAFKCLPSDIIIGDSYQSKPISGVRIPVLGRVQAGVPIEAVQEIIDYEEISEALSESGEFFALMVRGESMEPKFTHGDVVIVKKQGSVENGQIGIVIVNGQDATIKKVMKHDEGGLSLISLNPAYPPIYYTDKEVAEKPVEIIGKVIELRAKF